MAVISVNLVASGSKSNHEGRTGFKRWKVVVEPAQGDTAETARKATGVAVIGEAYDAESPTFLCLDKEANQDSEDGQMFFVDANYSTILPPNWTGNENENPLDAAPTVRWSEDATDEPFTRELNPDNTPGKAVTNSAGQRYDPQPTKQFKYRVATVIRNVAEVDHALWDTYHEAVNSDGFTIDGKTVGIGEAHILSITHDDAFANGIAYIVETIVIGIRKDGWLLNRLDDGYYELPLEPPLKPIQIKDEEGYPVTAPVWLDGAGHAKPQGPAITPNYRTHKQYPTHPFEQLDLPE